VSPRFVKWLKRLLLGAAILLTMLIATAAILLHMLRAEPQWYHRSQLDAQQRDAAAERALAKVANFHNQTAARHAADVRAHLHPSTVPATQPNEDITISFSDDELNALMSKWSVLDEARRAYDKFMEDPQVMLSDGNLVLAGKMKDLNAVVSLHFEPHLTPDGRLDLKLVRVLGGNLPLPQSLLKGYIDRLSDQVNRQIPNWKRRANFDSTGIANESMINVVMANLLIHTLNHQPSDAVVFLPIASQGSMPATLQEVRIDEATLTMTMRPMNKDQRDRLLQETQRPGPENGN
jgi:uncharacterized protein YpmS